MDSAVLVWLVIPLGLLLGISLGFLWARRRQVSIGAQHTLSDGYVGQPQQTVPQIRDEQSRAVEDIPASAVEILDVLPQASIVVGRGNRVLKYSQSAQTFGLIRSGEIAHTEVRDLIARVKDGNESVEVELRLSKGPVGNHNIVFQIHVVRMRDGLILVLAVDKTEAMRVEQTRQDFVVNVSHELKTPIGAMALLCEAIEDAADDPQAVRRFSGRLQRESARLTTLVLDIIELSRLQSSSQIHFTDKVHVHAVISEAVDRCRLAAEQKGVQIVVGSDSDLNVLGDRELLVTAIRNLIDNAIRYSPEKTKIGIGVRLVGNIVEIAVTDQGIGIPPDEIERVFERFYRVDQARSRATGGTGLGLSIVKHVVANHGGEVRVWSKQGHGSTFTLRIPRFENNHREFFAETPGGITGNTDPKALEAPTVTRRITQLGEVRTATEQKTA